ncbi:bifunctional phosphoribosylaminoimidazolecarboxamide formyltransferase/IMP cyclohydrolase PurH [Candidatus Fermentibacteria bacterium]|nr:MAG: bifunctional phosphoribosylaminoimidazolecarboxamide formyltransferase/IMP cyclohydrolase PurH [Candidatus Fermentibacteria bacterium]
MPENGWRIMADKTALISVWNKKGLDELATGLSSMGWKIYASGGTAGHIEKCGIDVIQTEEITGISSILGGRVKTLHPELHASILAAGEDREARIKDGKPVFDLVAVDFYPFEKTIGMEADDPELVGFIDIGGPTMARGAAKNWHHVISAAGCDVFPEVLEAIKNGSDDAEFRRMMASRTFDITSRYDLEISLSMERGFVPELRYGENPHQSAVVHFTWPRKGFGSAEVLGGKALSYNNYLDATAAWDLAVEMPEGSISAILMKHGNPCGAGRGSSPTEAFDNAFRADSVSPYGGILALNCNVDIELVARLKGIFLEIVMAPSFDEDALLRLQKRKKLRILRMEDCTEDGKQVRSINGGLLFQDSDPVTRLENIDIVSKRKPSEQELAAMDILWRVCRSVKSNAIVIGDRYGTLGVGAGQMSRIESLDLAVRRAEREGHSLKGAVLASDGFFPFRDGPEKAAEAGIAAIVQPGGSIRDEEVIDAVNEHGMTMVFTGTRHFRH